MAASLAAVTPRVQTINNDPMTTCTGHFTAGGSIKSRDNRWVRIELHVFTQRRSTPTGVIQKDETGHMDRRNEWNDVTKTVVSNSILFSRYTLRIVFLVPSCILAKSTMNDVIVCNNIVAKDIINN
ncbi:hypothetical protein TNCV_4750102 [Trichonephila clavipes]|nr:hypothetical protein TNCV_4750102 [Trichonephila clavipes]